MAPKMLLLLLTCKHAKERKSGERGDKKIVLVSVCVCFTSEFKLQISQMMRINRLCGKCECLCVVVPGMLR